MAEEESKALRNTVLLKEYEMCQQELVSVGNWIWASSTIFASAWVAALALVASTKADQMVAWILAGVAVPSEFLWLVFLMRCFRSRDAMYLRQRQIEEELTMFKSTVIEIAGRWRHSTIRYHTTDIDRNNKIEEFLKREKTEFPRGLLERSVMPVWEWLFGWWIGGEGRGALYAQSIGVILAWLAFAIWVAVSRG